MERITCYEAAELVLDEATGRFAPQFSENKEYKRIFRQYCDALDMLAEEFNGVAFDIEVDEISMEITVTLSCGEFVLESARHRFYQLAARAERMSFRAGEEPDTLELAFTFPPIWERNT